MTFTCAACGNEYRGEWFACGEWRDGRAHAASRCTACHRARNWVEPEVQWRPSEVFGGTWYLGGEGKVSTLGPFRYYVLRHHSISGKPCHTLAEAARGLVKEVKRG